MSRNGLLTLVRHIGHWRVELRERSYNWDKHSPETKFNVYLINNIIYLMAQVRHNYCCFHYYSEASLEI